MYKAFYNDKLLVVLVNHRLLVLKYYVKTLTKTYIIFSVYIVISLTVSLNEFSKYINELVQ